jgi:flagellar motor protein MotB
MLMEEDPPLSVPEWAITFGDLMALLLTFFVMLLSMSEFSSESKFRHVADSLEQRFGQPASRQNLVRDQRTAQAATAARTRRDALLGGRTEEENIYR